MRSREMHEIRTRILRRQRLLGANFLIERIAFIARDYKCNSFSLLKRQAERRKDAIDGLVRLRKALKANRMRRARKALYQWYYNELNPLKNLRQTALVSVSFAAKHPQITAFYRWRTAFNEQIVRHHQ